MSSSTPPIGGARSTRSPRPGCAAPALSCAPRFDVRFGKGATLVDPDALEVDLHLRFAIGRFGVRADMRELFLRACSIELAGRAVPTLAAEDRLLHACHHAVLGGFSGYRAARDVAQLLLVTGVDWEAARATAERWGVGAVIAAAIEHSWSKLRLEHHHPAVDWARRRPISRRDETAIEVFRAERPFREQALTALPALPWRLVPSYLLALGLPSAASRRARGRTLGEHVISRARALSRRRG